MDDGALPHLDLLDRKILKRPDGAELCYTLHAPLISRGATVAVVGGRGEFSEKKLKELQFLLDAGYHLIIVELRNQGQASRPLKGHRRQRDYIKNFDVHLNDWRDLYEKAVVPNAVGSVFVQGDSMGAHILARWLAEDKPPVKGGIVVAPMFAIGSAAKEITARAIGWSACKIGLGKFYAPFEHDFGKGKEFVFKDNAWTNDEARFEFRKKYFEGFRELEVGGATMAWVLAATRSLSRMRSSNYLNRIEVPLMVLLAAEDKKTPVQRCKKWAQKIPQAEIHIVNGSRHEIFNNARPIREEASRLELGFLKRILAAG